MTEPPYKSPLAVALSYDAPHAPRVTAVGRGWLGQKIIDTAKAHGVPLREDPALAEALSTLELDTEIPEALYAAVAKVIAFVLRAGTATAAAPRETPEDAAADPPHPAGIEHHNPYRPSAGYFDPWAVNADRDDQEV